MRRVVNGESTRRSHLNAQELVVRLQARAVELLKDEEEIWVVLDQSDLRKPYARSMEGLTKVRTLDGTDLVPGYQTLTALGMSCNKRGILYHSLFTSEEEGFRSERWEVKEAIKSVGEALKVSNAEISWILDRGFDDEKVWRQIWRQNQHLVVRIYHLERVVEIERGGKWERIKLRQAGEKMRELALVRTEMEVRKRGQKKAKRQEVTVRISACRVWVLCDGRKKVWLVQVKVEEAEQEPWWILTDWPVEEEEGAVRVFRMYRQRWAVEDSFKFVKQCFGQEEVRVLKLEAIRTLVTLGWVVAGFIYEMGVGLEWMEIQLLARLGGWQPRKNRSPGKIVLTRGLRRLLDAAAVEAVLADHIATYGRLPPIVAAIRGER